MSDAGTSRVTLIKYRGKETRRVLLEADNTGMSVNDDGSLSVTLYRYGQDRQALEAYEFTFGAEDRARLKREA